jgi:cytochrome c oxidase subunit 2
MKLLIHAMIALLFSGWLCATVVAQAAPAPQQPSGQDQSQDQGGRRAYTGLDAPTPPMDFTKLTAEQKRRVLIDTIRERMDLPAQADTGVLSPDLVVPQSASTTAPSTDGVLAYINFITIFFTALIMVLMIYFVWRYRSRSPDQPDPENVSTHSTTLELTWTVIPTCIVLVMFALGFRDFLNQAVAPPNAYRVDVTASMWTWQFMYPNGRTSSDLLLPAGRPVVFYLNSQDVLHSFFVPAFRIKKDVVPGRFNNVWTQPTTPGIFEIFCTEYCGTNHSRMVAKCFVFAPDRYDEALAWLTNIYDDPITGEPRPPEQVGAVLYETRGCIGCHSVDGSIKQAPTWKNLYGSTRTFADGSTRTADDAYIRQSIQQPSTQLVVGYGASMPSYAGQLDDRDINSIIAYLKSLSDDYKQTTTGDKVGPGQSQSIPPQQPAGGDGR